MPKGRVGVPVNNEEFVRVWQASSSLAAAAGAAGMDKRGASLRAHHMRKMGILLKTFNQVGERVDVEKLSAVAKKVGSRTVAITLRDLRRFLDELPPSWADKRIWFLDVDCQSISIEDVHAHTDGADEIRVEQCDCEEGSGT